MKIENYKLKIILLLIITIGAFLRFYKLDWGDGLFTHPDEYHIVASVNQLSFPNQMHPHFFSYGTVTIYLIYFTKSFLSMVKGQWSMVDIFLIGRFYSAFFSTLTILIVYKISRVFLKQNWSLLASFLVALTPGLIQQAHFATPESNLIFFLFGAFLFLLYFLERKKIRYLMFSSVLLGFALGVKVSSIVFLAPLIATIFILSLRSLFVIPSEARAKSRNLLMSILKFFRLTLASLITITIILAIVAPFVFLDFSAFRSNLEYEGNLAAGNIPVFYTRQFIQTIPVFFQLEKIFPYALGLPLLIAGIGGFFIALFNVMLNLFQHLERSEIPKQVRNDRNSILFLILLSFLSFFIPNAFLFAKWTRFIAPTFPFFAIFSAFLVSEIAKKQKNASYILTSILVVTTALWTMSFFSIYTKPDVRLTASEWLVSSTPPQSTMLIEGGNMIDIPLEGDFKRMGFDFYTFEEDQNTRLQIASGLEKADYLLVQSRRVFLNHQRARKQFPKTAHFYDMLFAGKLGFEQIKEFHSFPSLEIENWKLEIPDEVGEETWSVFDHPVIRVFKKTKKLPKEMYAKIFGDQ